jgi:hypothetical protein
MSELSKKIGKEIKKLLKENGINVSYKSESSYCFDYVISIDGREEDYEKASKLLHKYSYSDPENDMMSDYFGCHNSLILFNGKGV